MTHATAEKGPSIEQLLLDQVQRLKRNALGRRALVMHLSRLRPDYRRAHHIRIAANTFESFVKQFDGQIFTLQQGDIVFMCRDPNVLAVDEAVAKVRCLFGDDPLARHTEESENNFATWYDLSVDADYVTFGAYVGGLHEEAQARQKRIATAAPGSEIERQPMEPGALGELINAIVRADLSNVLRRQPVCGIVPGAAPQPIFNEIYVSIPDLRNAVMPRRDIASDRWLFQHLTQTLDKRVLALLRKADDRALAHSYSLNLNVATLLSPDFLAFDAGLRAGVRGSIVIELDKVEIFADLGTYLFARDFVRERGYRICLDGLNRLTLPFIDRDRLGLDLIKVFWSPDMTDLGDQARMREFGTAIERAGKSRVILARCDSEQAIAFGHSLGLRLFQGRYVDRLMSATGAGATPLPPARSRPVQPAAAS